MIVVIIITPFHSTIKTSPPTVLVDQSLNVDRGGEGGVLCTP